MAGTEWIEFEILGATLRCSALTLSALLWGINLGVPLGWLVLRRSRALAVYRRCLGALVLAVVVIASSPVVLAWYRLLSGYLAGVRAHPGTWGYLIRDATVKSSIGVAVVLGYAASPAIFWWLARRRLRRPSREPSPAPGGL